MASIAANQTIGAPAAKATAGDAVAPAEDNHGLARFFWAAGIALLFSALQGVIQRLPGISDWLLDADYGGHMVTNLAHTHITIVGAGTISLTGLIYYVLPKVTKRPLFSPALTNISFWATIIGVFGFYVAMICIGLYEGAMVHAGWPYEAARDYLGAWHKAPMAMTAAVMGIGYWTFVTNVYVTVGHASGERKVFPHLRQNDDEFLLAKFFVVGATGLLFGTVQGVYQVLPWALDWLHATGDAGHMIDPMAHAHMNLVGGVSVALMGLLYYFLPRMLGRKIYSMKLAHFSFWTTITGVFAFYFTAIALGFMEGSMMLDQHISDVQARQAMGIWHPLLLGLAASIMGVGFWSFITNVLLTLRKKATPEAPPDRTLAFFIGFAMVAILTGTIQGVIQVIQPIEEWLEEAGSSGYLITPLAHAQLNMVGFVIVSLATMSIFLLPRIQGRQVVDPARGRRALMVLCTGIVATYLVFFLVGLFESIAIHNGATAAQAREQVAGVWGRYALFIGAQAIVGIGYLLYFIHISRGIGGDVIRGYFRTFWGRMSEAGRQSTRVHERAMPRDPGMAQRRALQGFLFEAIGGAVGFLGMGWIASGRPFVGIMLLGSWGGGFWTVMYVVFAVAGGDQLLPYMLIPFFTIPVLSGIWCYRSYMRDARSRLTPAA